MSQLATAATALGVMVLMAVLAPFTRAREDRDRGCGTSGHPYVFYAVVVANVAVLAVGVTVAAVATVLG